MKRTIFIASVILLACVGLAFGQMYRGPSGGAVSPGTSVAVPLTQCATIKAASDTDDYPGLFRAAYAVTLRGWHCIQSGATNVVGGVDNCDGNATNCHAVSVDLTCTTVEADNSTLNAYSSVASGHWLGCHTTSVTGTNGWITICLDYTVD